MMSGSGFEIRGSRSKITFMKRKIEKVEIPRFKTVSAGDGYLMDVATGEVDVIYRGGGSSKATKKKSSRSKARSGRRSARE
jgi:hypothetical protein